MTIGQDAGASEELGVNKAGADAADPHKRGRLDAVVERLRATDRSTLDEELWVGGDADGSFWAEREATATELRRLARVCDPQQDWAAGGGNSAYSLAERVFFVVQPDYDGDRSAAAEFWEIATGATEPLDDVYVQAFAEAAVSTWHDVRDRV